MSLKRKETRYHVIFLVLWLVAHIPFLRSDPSIMLDSSRGAFTDEGLYLFQISNWFKGAGFEVFESDGFLKTPFYNLLMAPFIAFNRLWLTRLITVLFLGGVLSTWLADFGKNMLLPMLLCLMISLQVNFFGHSHLAMAECYVFGFLLLSLRFVFHTNTKQQYWGLFFLGLAIGCKIQYVYLGLLIIPYLAWIGIKHSKGYRLLLSAAPLLILGLLGLIFRAEYNYILAFAKSGKMQEWGHWMFRMKVNGMHLWETPFNVFLSVTTILMIAGMGMNWKKFERKSKWILIVLLGLLFIEGHKLLYIYLPQRYLYVFFGLVMLFHVYGVHLLLKQAKLKSWLPILVGILFILIPLFSYCQLLNQRSFDMISARESIKLNVSPDMHLIGPWGPSLSFGLTNPSHTAWKEFFENRAYWQANSKHVIVSELDFNDNQKLFSKTIQGGSYCKIDSFQIIKWELGVFTP